MKKIFTFLGFITLTTFVNAQVTNMGGPFSWKNKTTNNIPVETMAGYDQLAIDAEDLLDDQTKDHPWRFGYKYQTNYSTQNSGIWTTLPNGDRLWQLGISCPDARTINLLLEDFNLPFGAYLYLHDVGQTNRVGAYTARNNREDGMLGTELVHGDEIIVEYYEPAGVAGQGSFTITDVVHGYRSLKTIQNTLLGKALNSSGACNIDVYCPLGTGWEDQIRSVAMIVVSGNGICTGSLINNTCDDGTPYFLTANHCMGGGTGNWSFRFNWDTPLADVSCATFANSTDPGGPYDQTANGATILANGTVSDFGLVQIDNMTLGDAIGWNCFYAGWDNSDAQTVTQGTGIHHPSGDVKKICRENQSPYHTSAGSPSAQVWMIDDWDQGVTEPGSSGSPLYDQNGRIIGQLYGGAAACSGTNDNNQLDYYGRFGVSWTNGVSTYLAPGGCGSSTTNDGWDPNACPGIASSVNLDASCFGLADGSTTVSVAGGDAPFTFNIGSGPQGSGNFTGLTSGSYTVTIIDNNACTQVVSVTVNEPTELLVSSTPIDETCTGSGDGQIDINANGGTLPYTYDIGSGTQAGSNFPGLAPNTFNVTVTDANGCVTTDNGVVVATGTGVTANAVVTNISCNGLTDGEIQVVPTNGTGPFTYDIGSGTQSGDTFTGLTDGSYTIDIVDGFGCTGQVMGTVVEPTPLAASYTITDELSGNDGSINLTVTGGTPPYNHVWSGPNSFSYFSQDPNGLVGGFYDVVITDASGCILNVTGIEVGSSIGFGENELSFAIFPNPSNGIYYVQLANADENAVVNVMDVTGRLVHTEQIAGQKYFTIDISDKAAGTYFFTITDGSQQMTLPIVNQK